MRRRTPPESRLVIDRRSFLEGAGAAALLIGCGGTPSGGEPAPDAGDAPDGGADAGVGDAITDAMEPDAAPPDPPVDSSLTPWVFAHGVASGDPLADRVILWTRISEAPSDADVEVDWEVALDAAFADRVARGRALATIDADRTVKVDAVLPSPATTYFYRFRALGTVSPIGRTRTAPRHAEQLRVAVVSCSSIWSGFMNGYDRIAERGDLDLVVHCGDYIYDWSDGEERVRLPHDPVDEQNPVGLVGSRRRHAYYRRDASLRRAQQQHPWSIVWDNHDLDLDGDRADAIRAFHEWTPTRVPGPDRIHRALPFGDLLDVVLLDTRHTGRDTAFDAALPVDAPGNRSLLGRAQYDWLAATISASTATWRLLVNQVMMAPFRLFGQPLASGKWDSYPAERDRLLRHLVATGRTDTLVVTGDAHLTFVSQLEVGGVRAAVEMLPTSVTRGNLDETIGVPLGDLLEAAAEGALGLANPHFAFTELRSHGYGLVDITPARLTCEVWYTPIDQPVADQVLAAQLVCWRGAAHFDRVANPVATAGAARPLAPWPDGPFRTEGAIGGPGGAWFDDEPTLRPRPEVRGVVARGAGRVDRIGIVLADGVSREHGGDGGSAQSLALSPGEHLVEMVIEIDRFLQRVGRLELQTSWGREFIVGSTRGDRYQFAAPDGWHLVGFHGKAGGEIDRLGPIFAPIA